MSNYTKGPWVISELSYEEIEVLSSDNIFICSTPNIDPDYTGFNVCNETAANMDLITAAPDMLEALEELVEQLEGEHFCFKAARLAIAKAKGELK